MNATSIAPSDRPPLDLLPGRHVGVEIEFSGLSEQAAALALCSALGGTVTEEDPHAFLVRGSDLGDLRVELDTRFVHPQRHRGTRWGLLNPKAASLAGSAIRYFVPRELVTSPLPAARLPELDRAVETLRLAGAGASGPCAFGLHFNPGLVDINAARVTAILKAFLLLEDWLRRHSRPARPFHTGGAPVFPEAYRRQVLAPGYRPTMPRLIDDYLAANPTRDRGLDLLPLFLHLDEARVRARVPNEKIGGRASLHYRLPTAHVGEPGWSILPDWQRWMCVEHLASDAAALDRLAAQYLAGPVKPPDWAETAGRAVPGHAALELP